MSGCPYLAAALVYAARLGAAVVPLRGKRPAAEHGYASASTEAAAIRAMFAAANSTGVGIAAQDRFVIVDVDRVEALAELEQLPHTLTARSGGGGWHLYFARPAGLRLAYREDRFPSGIEVKLGNAGTVAPPSRHVTGGVYRWARRPPVADAPAWLLDALRAPERPPLPRGWAPVDHGDTPYGNATLSRHAQAVASAAAGTRRNALNGAAFSCAQLIPSGHLSSAAIEATLLTAAATTGLPPLEARRTVARALADGQARPYVPGGAR